MHPFGHSACQVRTICACEATSVVLAMGADDFHCSFTPLAWVRKLDNINNENTS